MKLNQIQSITDHQSSPFASSNTSDGSNSSGMTWIIIGGIAVGLIFLFFLLKPRNTNIFCINMLQFFYKRCFFRLDCASKLNPNEAIMRYIEEPPLEPEDFTNQVTSNTYIKCILNSFARNLPEYFLSILPSGSLREGLGRILPSTSVLASDFDIMLIPDAALVGHSNKTYVGNEKPLFATVESSEIEDGFLWLRLGNEYMLQWKELCIRRQTEGEGYSYLSSHKVHDLIEKTFNTKAWLPVAANSVIESGTNVKVDVKQSGPALTIKVTGKGAKACGMKCCRSLWSCCENDRDETVFYCDLTFSLHCPEWPDVSSRPQISILLALRKFWFPEHNKDII